MLHKATDLVGHRILAPSHGWLEVMRMDTAVYWGRFSAIPEGVDDCASSGATPTRRFTTAPSQGHRYTSTSAISLLYHCYYKKGTSLLMERSRSIHVQISCGQMACGSIPRRCVLLRRLDQSFASTSPLAYTPSCHLNALLPV